MCVRCAVYFLFFPKQSNADEEEEIPETTTTPGGDSPGCMLDAVSVPMDIGLDLWPGDSRLVSADVACPVLSDEIHLVRIESPPVAQDYPYSGTI